MIYFDFLSLSGDWELECKTNLVLDKCERLERHSSFKGWWLYQLKRIIDKNKDDEEWTDHVMRGPKNMITWMKNNVTGKIYLEEKTI